jgi:uncharacterized membrane protein
MVAVILAVEFTVAFAFRLPMLSFAGGVQIPVLWMVLGPLLILIPALVYAYRQSIKPRDPVDPTPNECWKGGMIYYNPNDAALFVQRHDSMGFTVNMANRWSWVLYASLALVLVSGFLLLRMHERRRALLLRTRVLKQCTNFS